MAEAIGESGTVYVSNVRPGISTTDQREEGFKLEMEENFPDITVLETQYNENDASTAASQLQAVLSREPELRAASLVPTSSLRWVQPTGSRQRVSSAKSP